MTRPLVNFAKLLLSVFLLTVVFFLLLNSPALIVRFRPIKASSAFLPPVTDSNPKMSHGLHIERLGINAPILYDQDATNELELLTTLQLGVSHLLGTARPGEIGSTVIVGHSSNYPWNPGKYKTIFSSLNRLQTGDYIQLQRGEISFIYQVSDKRVVKPTDLSVLAQTTEPQLILITCTPLGTTFRRLVVTARQISPQPSTNTVFNGQPAVGALPSPR